MKFGEMLSELQKGRVVRRRSYHSSLVIFMQIPATIPYTKVSTMQSIPTPMKKLMNKFDAGILYHDQFIMYDFSDQSCTYYPFDGEDINANDWEVVDFLDYDPYDDFR
jgi:hypothetical protein